MGLFKKKKADYLEIAFDAYFRSAVDAAQSRLEYCVWNAWGHGALAVGEGLEGIPAFKVTPRDLDKAKLLVELYVQPMISLWYYEQESQKERSDEEKKLARRTAFENVQTFLGLSSEDSVKLYLGFDREFQVSIKGEGKEDYYLGMFYQRLWECLTDERIVDWARLEFPIVSLSQFLSMCDMNRYHYELEKNPTLADPQLAGVITSAGVQMFRQFKSTYKTA